MKKKEVAVFTTLMGIIAFHIANNYIISSIDLAPFFQDVATYISVSFRAYSALIQYKFFDAFFSSSLHYPSLFYISSFPFYLLFGLSQKSAVMTNSIFLVILVFSVYGIGRMLHSREAGVLSAFIVTSFPGVFSLSRTYLHDFALVAMVALSIYCLLRTKKFTQKKFSVFLGLAVGFGMAIKPAFVIFFFGPFCYYSFISFRDVYDRADLFKRLKNFIIFLVTNLFLIVFFYIPNFLSKLSYLHFAVFVTRLYVDNFKWFSLENILYHLKNLLGVQILYFYFALFLLGAVLFLKSNRKYKPLLFLWFLVPYIFFTFMGLRVNRYTAPYLPVIPLIISMAIFDLRKVTFRRILTFLIVLIGLIQFFLVSYMLPSGDLVNLDKNLPSSESLVSYFNRSFYPYQIDSAFAPERIHAYSTDYGIGEVGDYIKNSDRINKQDQIIFFDIDGIIMPTVDYLLYQDNNSLEKRIGTPPFLRKPIFTPPQEFNVAEEVIRALNDTDFFVLSSDYIDNSTDLRNIAFKSMNLIKKIDLETGKHLYIFENKLYTHKLYTHKLYTQDGNYKRSYQNYSCKDCTISLSYMDNNLLKIDYNIPYNRKDWQVFLHKLWERVSGAQVDYGWIQINKQLGNLDWSNFISLSFLVKSEGKPTRIELSILEADGDEWFYFDDKSLNNNDWILVTCPFKDFTNPRWAKHGDKKKNLDNIISIKITLTSFDKGVTQTVFFKLFEDEVFYLNSF